MLAPPSTMHSAASSAFFVSARQRSAPLGPSRPASERFGSLGYARESRFAPFDSLPFVPRGVRSCYRCRCCSSDRYYRIRRQHRTHLIIITIAIIKSSYHSSLIISRFRVHPAIIRICDFRCSYRKRRKFSARKTRTPLSCD